MKRTLLVLLILIYSDITIACDGCSMYEYSTVRNRSYVALFYRYRVFNGYDHMGNSNRFLINAGSKLTHAQNEGFQYDEHEDDFELYHSYEFRANLAIAKKYNLMLLVPYQTSVVHYERVIEGINPIKDTTFGVSGMGDIILAGERVYQFEKEQWQHNLKLGFGVKIPTGNFKATGGDANNAYHPTLQPGTGSWDGIFRVNYVGLFANTLGINHSMNYRMNSGVSYTAEDGEKAYYRFGNRFNARLSLFWLITLPDIRIAPSIGGYLEEYGYDWRTDFIEEGTGGTSFFGTAGLDFTYQDVTLQLLYQRNVAESLHDEQIGNAGRFVSGVIWNF